MIDREQHDGEVGSAVAAVLLGVRRQGLRAHDWRLRPRLVPFGRRGWRRIYRRDVVEAFARERAASASLASDAASARAYRSWATRRRRLGERGAP